jgi:hypothetical protein
VSGAATPKAARRWLVALSLVPLWCAAPTSASAQNYIPQDVPRRGSLVLSGGVNWAPGYDLGSSTANETRNPGSGTGPFVLFQTSSRIESAPGLQGRLGVYLSPTISVEGGGLFSRPDLSVRLTGDAESAPDLTATERLNRFVADGSVLFHLVGASFGGGRGVPFVFGGAGYLRDLHEKNEVADTGHEFHFGGGLHYWFGEGKHRAGLRTEVNVSRRHGGADGADTTRTVPTVAGSFAYLF